jgi:tol-pal system protein YbgF
LILATRIGRSMRFLRLAAVLLAGLSTPVLMSRTALAQDAEAAQLTLRIQNLEAQVRDLTGQVQGLQFQLTQLQTMVNNSGAGNGQSPPSQSQNSSQSDDSAGPGAPPAQLAGANDDDSGNAAAGSDDQGDDLGPSSDPLVGRGQPGVAPGADEVPLGPSRGPTRNDGVPPRVASVDTSAAPVVHANPEAEAQYKAGYDAIVKGNYSFAADQFRKFIKSYPNDPQAADATNWLGEALLQQQNYDDAADVLVNGYKTFRDSPRAPDLLLKLGIALAGAQHPDAACKAFGLLGQKYPGTTTAFKTRLQQEMAKDKCPA